MSGCCSEWGALATLQWPAFGDHCHRGPISLANQLVALGRSNPSSVQI